MEWGDGIHLLPAEHKALSVGPIYLISLNCRKSLVKYISYLQLNLQMQKWRLRVDIFHCHTNECLN